MSKLTREEALEVIKHMSDSDKADFYKKEMEAQESIVFNVSKERNKLKDIILNTHKIMKQFDEQRAYEYLTNKIEDLKIK